jgi:hypothetical protein
VLKACGAIGRWWEVGSTGRKFGQWRYALEEDIGTPIYFCFSLYFLVTMR